MPVNRCRICGQQFFSEPLLRYTNMPKTAQKFPNAADLADDTGVELEVCQCAGCGLVQLSNDPVPYYREVIRAAVVSTVLLKSKSRQFAALIQKYGLQGKKIIEIGCGCGEFLSLLPTLGVAAHGLEYSPAAVGYCRDQGLTVEQGYVDGPTTILANGPFDAFLLLMFLEHMPDPNGALRGIYNNLRETTVGLIEVPNFEMLMRKKLFSEFIGDHLLYFTPETLETTLNLNGFEILECSVIRDEYVISVVVRKRCRLDISHFDEYQLKITAEIQAYLARFPAKRVAVWGAGHQALAIIALTGIADGIRYVVDSAPFKQGKYTPATHLPVVAPQVLSVDPVDAVIVMAASYSDEVAGIIRQQLGPRMPIAILRDFGLELI